MDIKLRAWNGKCFYNPIIYDGRIFRNDWDFVENLDYTDQLMQWTGIGDIYESDIVEVQSTSLQGITFKGEVKYLEQKACYVVENDKGEWINLNDDDEIRVLGNVYEGVRG